MLAQAGIFNPIFVLLPLLYLIACGVILCSPLFIFYAMRARRIRRIEAKSREDLEAELAAIREEVSRDERGPE